MVKIVINFMLSFVEFIVSNIFVASRNYIFALANLLLPLEVFSTYLPKVKYIIVQSLQTELSRYF